MSTTSPSLMRADRSRALLVRRQVADRLATGFGWVAMALSLIHI